jgi:hypothetical protein
VALRAVYPRLSRQVERPVASLGRVGDQTLFYGKALAGIPFAAVHYRREVIRLIAEISMGAGTLAMIGGTVVIVGFLTLAAGGTLAVQGFSSLGNIGIEALTGFLAAFINVRIAAPVVAGIGLAATFGAGVTAQLGAMRINEEIDALEAMAIRRNDSDHAVVLHRRHSVVPRQPVHHNVFVRTVGGVVPALLLDLLEPDRLVVVVPAGRADGDHDLADTHVLRLFRGGWTCRRRPGDG